MSNDSQHLIKETLRLRQQAAMLKFWLLEVVCFFLMLAALASPVWLPPLMQLIWPN